MKQGFSILILCLLAACVGGGEGASSGGTAWRLFRGDPSLGGYTEVCLPEAPELLWAYKGGERTVSSPVVEGGTTYWCDRRGRISGVDMKGEMVFSYDLQTAVEATPMIYDSTLYIGRIDGFMTALSLRTKDTLWNYETMGQISASPNMADFAGGKAVVFGSYDNYLYCVDAVSGKEVGRFESGYYLNGAAALCGEYVIFGGCDAWVRIVDGRTGVKTDSLLLDAYIPASPAVKGDYCYVGDYSGNIYELLLSEGKIVHHRKLAEGDEEKGSFVAIPAVSGKAVYFFSGDRELCAVGRGGEWSFLLKGEAGESSPLVCGDKLLVCTKTGIISILDAEWGKLLWEYDAGEPISASPAVIAGRFMVLTTKGTLLCFGASE